MSGYSTATSDRHGDASFYFAEGIPKYETENTGRWFSLNVDHGVVSGWFEESLCQLVCGSFISTDFTGFVTREHEPEDRDGRTVVTPEPSSLLLTGIVLLGIAAFCSLRRRSPVAICRG